MSQRESIFNMLDQLSDQLDRESVVDLVELYFTNSQATLHKIAEAAKHGDLPVLCQEAHALKSSSANLGALALSQLCLKLEKSQQLDTITKDLITEAEKQFLEATAIMREWCAL